MDNITQKEIFDLVNDVRKELSSHILRLEAKFDTLEAGRLSRLEAKFSQLEAQSEPVKKIVFGLVALTLTIVFTGLIYLIIKQ